MKSNGTGGGLVYSTGSGRMCPICRQPVAACRCGRHEQMPGDGMVRVSRETKGRAGKGVTLVRGVALPLEPLAELARRLRTACGAGGTVKDGVIEIQGDHRDKVLERLVAEGHPAKRAGG